MTLLSVKRVVCRISSLPRFFTGVFFRFFGFFRKIFVGTLDLKSIFGYGLCLRQTSTPLLSFRFSMISFSEYVRTCYAPTYLFGQLSLGTIREYVATVCKYISIVGDCPLDELDTAKHSRFILGLQQQGLAVETIRKHCRHLNTIWAKAGPAIGRHRDSLRFLSEAPWIRPPQSFRKLPREIPDTLADQLYKAIVTSDACYEFPRYLDREMRPNWWRALIRLVASTGIRRRVVFGLQWSDFDISNKFFIVPAEIDKKRSERVKPVHREVYRLLEAVRSGEFVLPWSHGSKKFYEIWGELNETAGIMPHLRLHDLKRYCLQLACRSGVDAATLQMLGDHASLQTTMNHYVRGNLERYVETVRLPGQEVNND